MYKFFAITSLSLSLSLFLFVGGCAQGSFGTVQYSHVFQSAYTIDVVNNTNVLLDVEYGGQLVKKNLTPGETFSYPVWAFRHGDQVYMTVKGHRNGGYLGTANRRFNLRTSYGFRRSTPRKHEVWTVDRLQTPRDY
jgi:hypothetical protein